MAMSTSPAKADEFCFASNYFIPVASSAKYFPLSALGEIIWSSAIHLILTADRIKNGEELKENLKIAAWSCFLQGASFLSFSIL